MTAMIGLPIAIVVGIVFGFGRRQVLFAAAVWYATLAWQTAYLAQVGVTSFDGGTGLHTVRWWVYWTLQPILLAAATGLIWLGARGRSAVTRRFRPTASSSPG